MELSQSGLAILAGVSVSTIRRLESGNPPNIRIDKAINISRALYSKVELLFYKETDAANAPDEQEAADDEGGGNLCVVAG